jgi:hypothetical protein
LLEGVHSVAVLSLGFDVDLDGDGDVDAKVVAQDRKRLVDHAAPYGFGSIWRFACPIERDCVVKKAADGQAGAMTTGKAKQREIRGE